MLKCEHFQSLCSSWFGKHLYSRANLKENLSSQTTTQLKPIFQWFWMNSSAWSPFFPFFFDNLQMLVRGKKSTVNSWEGMSVDSLSSSKASSERDITSAPKAVNNAVRLILRISKLLMKEVIYTEIWISMEMSQCCKCQSFSFIYENRLRNQPQGDAKCYCENNAFKMA